MQGCHAQTEDSDVDKCSWGETWLAVVERDMHEVYRNLRKIGCTPTYWL